MGSRNRLSNWSATGYPAALVLDDDFDYRPDIQIYISGWTDINRDDILYPAWPDKWVVGIDYQIGWQPDIRLP